MFRKAIPSSSLAVRCGQRPQVVVLLHAQLQIRTPRDSCRQTGGSCPERRFGSEAVGIGSMIPDSGTGSVFFTFTLAISGTVRTHAGRAQTLTPRESSEQTGHRHRQNEQVESPRLARSCIDAQNGQRLFLFPAAARWKRSYHAGWG